MHLFELRVKDVFGKGGCPLSENSTRSSQNASLNNKMQINSVHAVYGDICVACANTFVDRLEYLHGNNRALLLIMDGV